MCDNSYVMIELVILYINSKTYEYMFHIKSTWWVNMMFLKLKECQKFTHNASLVLKRVGIHLLRGERREFFFHWIEGDDDPGTL